MDPAHVALAAIAKLTRDFANLPARRIFPVLREIDALARQALEQTKDTSA